MKKPIQYKANRLIETVKWVNKKKVRVNRKTDVNKQVLGHKNRKEKQRNIH